MIVNPWGFLKKQLQLAASVSVHSFILSIHLLDPKFLSDRQEHGVLIPNLLQDCHRQSCEVSHRERVPARSGSGQVFYTAHFYMLAQKVYTMRRDLRYNFQERQDTKVEALSTVVYNNTT